MHKTRTKIIIGIIAAIVLLAGIAYWQREQIISLVLRPTDSSVETRTINSDRVEIVAENLQTTWSIAFLPDGTRVVTERTGAMRIGDSVVQIDDVTERGEGGLLGVAIDPDFETNQYMYVYFTTDRQGGTTNVVERYVLRDGTLTAKTVVVENIPGASTHNGGAIEFGPDGKLYVATGDAANPDLAQDRGSLAGKILRYNPDGTIPEDNPFEDNPVWSYGHRNPQGVAWSSDGRMWSVEHGPRSNDEVNEIKPGQNYGWPLITGTEQRDGLVSPVATSGADETWAPSRLVYADGSLYFTGLRGQSVYRAEIQGENVELSRFFTGEYGRLRGLAVHEGKLHVGTSNRDGRGQPAGNDDRILAVPLQDIQ